MPPTWGFNPKVKLKSTRGDVTLWKTFTFTKLFVRETEFSSSERPSNQKESAACLITKASNSPHFHIPLIFFILYFPSHAVSEIFDTFSHLRNFNNEFHVESLYHKDSNMFCLKDPLNKVKPCSAGLVLGWVTNYEYHVLW